MSVVPNVAQVLPILTAISNSWVKHYFVDVCWVYGSLPIHVHRSLILYDYNELRRSVNTTAGQWLDFTRRTLNGYQIETRIILCSRENEIHFVHPNTLLKYEIYFAWYMFVFFCVCRMTGQLGVLGGGGISASSKTVLTLDDLVFINTQLSRRVSHMIPQWHLCVFCSHFILTLTLVYL